MTTQQGATMTDDKLNEGLAGDIDEALAPLRDYSAAVRADLSTPPATTERRTDLEALLHTGDKLLDQQHAKLSGLQSEYEISRVTLADDYRKRMDALRLEGAEAIRALDARFQADIKEAERTIEVIEALRKAGQR